MLNNEIKKEPSRPDLTPILEKWSTCFARLARRDMLAFARSSGLTLPAFFMLLFLSELEGCEIGELGHYEQVSFTTVSQQVDRICQLKLLKRGERPEDRCVHTVHLSQKGLYLVHGTLAHRRQWLAQIVATLSQEEQCQIAAALQGWFN